MDVGAPDRILLLHLTGTLLDVGALDKVYGSLYRVLLVHLTGSWLDVGALNRILLVHLKKIMTLKMEKFINVPKLCSCSQTATPYWRYMALDKVLVGALEKVLVGALVRVPVGVLDRVLAGALYWVL